MNRARAIWNWWTEPVTSWSDTRDLQRQVIVIIFLYIFALVAGVIVLDTFLVEPEDALKPVCSREYGMGYWTHYQEGAYTYMRDMTESEYVQYCAKAEE